MTSVVLLISPNFFMNIFGSYGHTQISDQTIFFTNHEVFVMSCLIQARFVFIPWTRPEIKRTNLTCRNFSVRNKAPNSVYTCPRTQHTPNLWKPTHCPTKQQNYLFSHITSMPCKARVSPSIPTCFILGHSILRYLTEQMFSCIMRYCMCYPSAFCVHTWD